MAENHENSISLEEAVELVVALLPQTLEKAKQEQARFHREAEQARKDYGDFLAELVAYRRMGFFRRLAFAFGLYRPAPGRDEE